MSLEDLEVRKHTKPILAELDRQKEKCARMKDERNIAREEVRRLRILVQRLVNVASADSQAYRDARAELAPCDLGGKS